MIYEYMYRMIYEYRARSPASARRDPRSAEREGEMLYREMLLLIAGVHLSIALAAPVTLTPTPSLRNGLPGTALANHRWLSVPPNGTHAHQLEAVALAAGVPSHLTWVNDQGALELIVPPSLKESIEGLLGGREYTVLREDAQAWLEAEKEERRRHPLRLGMPKDEFYRAWRTLDEILAYTRGIAEGAGPGVAVNEIVVGETHEGRPIRGFTIDPVPWGGATGDSRRSEAEGKKQPNLPRIMMHGCHHSGEWITAMGTVYFFEQLVTGYGEDEEITTLVDSYQWILVPVVNVDGCLLCCNIAVSLSLPPPPTRADGRRQCVCVYVCVGLCVLFLLCFCVCLCVC